MCVYMYMCVHVLGGKKGKARLKYYMRLCTYMHVYRNSLGLFPEHFVSDFHMYT